MSKEGFVMGNREQQEERDKKLPIAKNEDVEFSMEAADEEDIEAVKRMEAADSRQES
jgi:hypothetical protein